MKIVFDFSKYIDHFLLPGPTGISRVDLEYARYLAMHPEHFACGIHRRFLVSTRFSLHRLRALISALERNWREMPDGEVMPHVLAWLEGREPQTRRVQRAGHPAWSIFLKANKLWVSWPWHNCLQRIPEGAVYINTAYAGLKSAGHLAWLDRRPDVTPVFMVHDLIPLREPTLFWDRLREDFPRQINAIMSCAKLVVTPSEVVSSEVRALAARHGRSDLEVRSIALPPGNEFIPKNAHTIKSADPYFVICGTIEPRKNHQLLLDVWLRMKALGGRVPRLIVVGRRGWKNDAVFACLDRAEELRGHVLEVSDLSSPDLAVLMAGASGLLMPSLDEGFGLPLVEALACGTPVIASDIAVFREVTRGCAQFCDLGDADAWRAAIYAHAFDDEVRAEARRRAAAFPRRTWQDYFGELEGLLRGLSAR